MDEQTSDSNGPLSEAEHRELLALLHRYCSYDLDQWEAWRMQPSTARSTSTSADNRHQPRHLSHMRNSHRRPSVAVDGSR